MTFEEKLTNREYDRIWQEYCGFLDLDMASYMKIQRRLFGGADGTLVRQPSWKENSKGQETGEYRGV